ncbi:MAG: hypothetical protein II114_02245 [Treponema sp.]|nr:hypothetical protein [Treponema sp.]
MDCKKTALFFMLTAAACFFSCRVDIDGTGQMGGTGDSGEKPEDPSVEYNVSHLLQNINDDGYTEADCETLIGKPDCMTEAVQKDYEGFILKDSVPNCKISSDGSTIVKIHYDRKLYEVVFDAGEGVFKGAGENGEDVRTVTRKFRHGQKIEPPEASSTKDGYKVQWPDFGTAGSGSVNSYTASWESGLADYGIRSYFESVSGDFEEAEDKRSVKSGKPGTETKLGKTDAQSFTGFTFDHADNTVISEDGTSFVSFYYKRNYYTLTFDAGSGKFADGKSSVQKSFKYGQTVEIPEASREGYTAIWAGVPNVCPAGNAKYTATWKANENTPYKIKHFLMNVDGKTWTERTSDASTGHGTTDSQTALTESNAKSYEGFTFNEVKNTTIAADGSSVVGFYYRRNYYTITFVAQGGTFETGTTVSSDGNAQVKVIYEGTVKAPYVSKAGYEVSWPEFEACTGAKTYTATWKPRNDTPYNLEVFVQHPESGEYTLESSKTQKGTTGETSAVTPEPREHYNAKVEQTVIKADGSGKAVVKYELKTSVLTFNAGEGIFKGAGAGGSDAKSVSLTLRYGQKVVVPEAFRDGYKAIWDGVPNVCPAENAAYTATWKIVKGSYTVEVWVQQPNGTYGMESSRPEQGTIGETTAVVAENRPHYAKTVTQTVISGDGSDKVKISYALETVTLALDAGKGKFESTGENTKTLTGLYGAAVSVEEPVRQCWFFRGWSSDLSATFETSGTYTAKWEFDYTAVKKKYTLTAAVNQNGTDVISNFSTAYPTTIQLYTTDVPTKSPKKTYKAEDNPVCFRFHHKKASSDTDGSNFNAFYGTSDIDPESRTITGHFYGGFDVTVSFSEDCKTIVATMSCNNIYTDGFLGFHGYPFGTKDTYTMTFTRQ